MMAPPATTTRDRSEILENIEISEEVEPSDQNPRL